MALLEIFAKNFDNKFIFYILKYKSKNITFASSFVASSFFSFFFSFSLFFFCLPSLVEVVGDRPVGRRPFGV